MIVDFTRDRTVLSERFDVCIIGAGAAGLTLSLELARRGARVVLLEAGGLSPDKNSQRLYSGHSIGHPCGLSQSRVRAFGGSTNRWSGRCIELDDSDFNDREWVPAAEWRLSKEKLSPFYKRARDYLGLDHEAIPAELSQTALNSPVFSDELTACVWRYPAPGAHTLNWGRRFREPITGHRGILALVNAPVIDFETAPSNSVIRAALVHTAGPEAYPVKAKSFVLCAGGIENARLLLASKLGHPGGIANPHGQVGRFFMQHPRGVAAHIHCSKTQRKHLTSVFGKQRVGKACYEVGLGFSMKAQRKSAALNCSAVISPGPALADVFGSVARSWRSKHRQIPMATLHNALAMKVLKDGPLEIVVDVEQMPDAESTVSLSDERDALGLPRARVAWKIGESERHTAREFIALIQKRFDEVGAGRVTPAPWLFEQEPFRALTGSKHHIGSTRMSEDDRTGVVGHDCRVHNVENLYISGSSVFSSGGHANPTWTIVAMAIRLADLLALQIGV